MYNENLYDNTHLLYYFEHLHSCQGFSKHVTTERTRHLPRRKNGNNGVKPPRKKIRNNGVKSFIHQQSETSTTVMESTKMQQETKK